MTPNEGANHMVEVPFTVPLTVSLSPLRQAELCQIECKAQSEVNGAALGNVYVIVREDDGTEHDIEMLPAWPYSTRWPLLTAMGPRIWAEARGHWVTRELEIMWNEQGQSAAERRAEAYADYRHDQRHG